MAALVGKRAQIGMDPTTPATELYEILGGDLQLIEDIHDPDGIRGTRSHASERKRQNTRRVSGSLTFQPNSVELDTLLVRILGGTESLDDFPLAETLPTFDVDIAREDGTDGKVFVYTTCVCSRTTFRCVQGGPLEMTLEIEGADETVNNAGTFPSLTLDTSSGPYIMSDCVLSVNSVTVSFREFALVIDNHVDTERFFNNQVRQSFPARDRTVTWSLSLPYGDSETSYALTATGVACVATFTNGNRSLAFSSNKVSFPRLSPQINGFEEIMLPLEGMAAKDGSTAELVTTNDSTG